MKDPAFLFYPNDYLGGTMGMTFEQKGAYMELLMLQFNRGHMTSHMIGQTVGQLWDNIKDKFVQDDNGLWYNVRLEEEKTKRENFTKSRRNNLLGINQYSKKERNSLGHTTSRMENRNRNEIININKNILLHESEIWIEDICMKKNYIKQQVIDKLGEFIQDQELKDEMDRPINQIKSHFISWLNKQEMMQNKSYDKFLEENNLKDNSDNRNKYDKYTKERYETWGKN